jgi:transcriptional regulator with XRE-family HTH domain
MARVSFDIDLIEETIARLEGVPEPAGGDDQLPDGDGEPVAEGAVAGLLGPIQDALLQVERSLAAPPPAPTALELLGRYARRGRYFARFSQRALSKRSGVSQSTISRSELGKAGSMPVGRLVLIGAVLGRAFPLGYCPHQHRCALQPIWPPAPLSETEVIHEELAALGLDLGYTHLGLED